AAFLLLLPLPPPVAGATSTITGGVRKGGSWLRRSSWSCDSCCCCCCCCSLVDFPAAPAPVLSGTATTDLPVGGRGRLRPATLPVAVRLPRLLFGSSSWPSAGHDFPAPAPACRFF
ncbi:unnamed protein product, partial [Ectocarpus sp. 12 AP-2014]